MIHIDEFDQLLPYGLGSRMAAVMGKFRVSPGLAVMNPHFLTCQNNQIGLRSWFHIWNDNSNDARLGRVVDIGNVA